MLAEIMERLDMERGCMEPVHLPLKLLHNEPICSCYEDAENRLDELYDTFGRRYNYGVMYYDCPDTRKKKDLGRRIEEMKKKAEKYGADHSVINFKADYVGCHNCGSKLNRKFLRGDKCMVCKADMRSETTLKTLKGYSVKIKWLEKEMREENKKSKDKAKVCWLVHAEAYIG